MKINNYYVENINYFIDKFIRKLIKNNISYVLLSNENYIEIHFLNNIYKFYLKSEVQQIFYNASHDPFNELFGIIYDNNINKKFVDNAEVNISCKKERPGFKKYTKKDIRRDSKNNKTISKVKKKLSMYY